MDGQFLGGDLGRGCQIWWGGPRQVLFEAGRGELPQLTCRQGWGLEISPSLEAACPSAWFFLAHWHLREDANRACTNWQLLSNVIQGVNRYRCHTDATCMSLYDLWRKHFSELSTLQLPEFLSKLAPLSHIVDTESWQGRCKHSPHQHPARRPLGCTFLNEPALKHHVNKLRIVHLIFSHLRHCLRHTCHAHLCIGVRQRSIDSGWNTKGRQGMWAGPSKMCTFLVSALENPTSYPVVSGPNTDLLFVSTQLLLLSKKAALSHKGNGREVAKAATGPRRM